jgi:hypothetical protein
LICKDDQENIVTYFFTFLPFCITGFITLQNGRRPQILTSFVAYHSR